MSELTDDEATILMIAAQGESMMPIGRWEKPVEMLLTKGMLARLDKFNNVITPAGRQAVEDWDKGNDDSYRQMLELGSKITNAREQAMKSVEQAAIHLSMAAKATAQVTGDTVLVALEKLVEITKERAKQKL